MHGHWVDGSFVTKKADPGDVDVVTIFESSAYDALDAIDHTLLRGLLSHKLSRELHGCDSYAMVFYPPDHPARPTYEAACAYWDGLFGHDRGGNPKGYVELVTT
jgi:hypothetical protein